MKKTSRTQRLTARLLWAAILFSGSRTKSLLLRHPARELILLGNRAMNSWSPKHV